MCLFIDCVAKWMESKQSDMIELTLVLWHYYCVVKCPLLYGTFGDCVSTCCSVGGASFQPNFVHSYSCNVPSGNTHGLSGQW